jgi:hypothetical protein
MAIAFDLLFLGDKFNLFIDYEDVIKKPIDFQMDILKSIGLYDILANNLSFFKSYILVTVVNSYILYNIGRVLGKKLFKK